jgi:multidrug transporter EmrE-like cation transporter
MPISPLMGGTLLTLIESVGDYALKRFALEGHPLAFAVGFGIYGALAAVLVYLFKTLGLAITNAYWDATSNVISMLVGYFLLHEVYEVKQWIGMGIVTVGMLLINGH